MSEPGPESIPTSADPRSHRPVKKRALTPVSKHSAHLEALFANPERAVQIPDSAAGKSKGLAPPPEIVTNVQGSSAGAGSGEFHVYKASRRREFERVRLMEEEVENEVRQKEWSEKREELKKREEKKTSKNKAKRDRAKARKEKPKGAAAKIAPRAPNVGRPARSESPDQEVHKGVANGDGQAEVREDADAIPGIVIHDED